MSWRDVIGAVLDATAAAPAPQARRTTAASNRAAAPASDARARLAQSRPARPAPPEPERPAPERAWSAAVFDHIEWRRFEAVCEALFAQSGMRSESQSHGADGGVDIWLYSQHSDKPVIVQCKHWKKRVVGVKELREFYGVLRSHDPIYGTFATSSTFSSDALAFAKSNRINAQDREGLLRLIAGRSAEQRQALLETADLREVRSEDGSAGEKRWLRVVLGLRELREDAMQQHDESSVVISRWDFHPRECLKSRYCLAHLEFISNDGAA